MLQNNKIHWVNVETMGIQDFMHFVTKAAIEITLSLYVLSNSPYPSFEYNKQYHNSHEKLCVWNLDKKNVQIICVNGYICKQLKNVAKP